MCGKKIHEFVILAENSNITDKVLQDHLKDYWGLLGSVSGLIAGFSFLVVAGEPEFGNSNATISRETRQILFGIFIMITFMTSLGATLLASMMYANILKISEEKVRWFIKTFPGYIRAPAILMGMSIASMLISAMWAVGDYLLDSVYYPCLAVGLIIFGFVLFASMQVAKGISKEMNSITPINKL